MVTFLLLIKNITPYSKSDVDKGKVPLDIYKLCSCIREVFCLSYSIRKLNFLYLYFLKEYLIIQFDGKKLRYLGPDERSQALLLNKAIELAKKSKSLIFKDWIQSTPGISVKGFQNNKYFNIFLKSLLKGYNYLLLDHAKEELVLPSDETTCNINELLFIIPTYTISHDNSDVFELFQNLKTIKSKNLSKIEGIENQILYINFQIDQKTYNDS